MRTLVRLVMSFALMSQIVASSSVLAQEAKADPPEGPVAVEYICATVAWACPRKLSDPVTVKVPANTPIEDRDQAAIDKLGPYSCQNSTAVPRLCYIEDWHACAAVAPEVRAERTKQCQVYCSYIFCNGDAIAFVGTGCCYADAVRNANCIAHRKAQERCTRVRCREYCAPVE